MMPVKLRRKQGTTPKSSTSIDWPLPDTSPSIKQHIPSHLQRELHKERRRQEKIPDLARKSPMYDNIKMTDPNGELLATISLKKARWYVRKQLAEWTEPNTCIQLLFTPKAYSGGGYEKSIKNNVCVGCGSKEYHMRHYVVPYAYRTLLPKRYKTHLSHDVVILCPDCHLLCEHETQLRMKELEDLRPQECRNASFVDQHLQRVRSAALALLRWRDKLPLAKIDEYNALICHYLKISCDSVEELSSKQLQEAIDVDCRMPNPKYIPGPEYVVRSLNNDDGKIEEFIKEWRQHFVDTLQPRFLPEGWSIDAPVTSNVFDSDDESEDSKSKWLGVRSGNCGPWERTVFHSFSPDHVSAVLSETEYGKIVGTNSGAQSQSLLATGTNVLPYRVVGGWHYPINYSYIE